jgi:hypothetical protein
LAPRTSGTGRLAQSMPTRRWVERCINPLEPSAAPVGRRPGGSGRVTGVEKGSVVGWAGTARKRREGRRTNTSHTGRRSGTAERPSNEAGHGELSPSGARVEVDRRYLFFGAIAAAREPTAPRVARHRWRRSASGAGRERGPPGKLTSHRHEDHAALDFCDWR